MYSCICPYRISWWIFFNVASPMAPAGLAAKKIEVELENHASHGCFIGKIRQKCGKIWDK